MAFRFSFSGDIWGKMIKQNLTKLIHIVFQTLLPGWACSDGFVNPDQLSDVSLHEEVPVREHEVQGQEDQSHERNSGWNQGKKE